MKQIDLEKINQQLNKLKSNSKYVNNNSFATAFNEGVNKAKAIINAQTLDIPKERAGNSSLQELIFKHPNLPILVGVGGDAYQGNYDYEFPQISDVRIEEFIEFGEEYCTQDEYEEKLRDSLNLEEEYSILSDEEFDIVINKRLEKAKFNKYIVVYVG